MALTNLSSAAAGINATAATSESVTVVSFIGGSGSAVRRPPNSGHQPLIVRPIAPSAGSFKDPRRPADAETMHGSPTVRPDLEGALDDGRARTATVLVYAADDERRAELSAIVNSAARISARSASSFLADSNQGVTPAAVLALSRASHDCVTAACASFDGGIS